MPSDSFIPLFSPAVDIRIIPLLEQGLYVGSLFFTSSFKNETIGINPNGGTGARAPRVVVS
jgi:hypothetical protein